MALGFRFQLQKKFPSIPLISLRLTSWSLRRRQSKPKAAAEDSLAFYDVHAVDFLELDVQCPGRQMHFLIIVSMPIWDASFKISRSHG